MKDKTANPKLPSPDFDLDSVEGGLEQMDVASVPGDHQRSIGPLGIFVSADQEALSVILKDSATTLHE